MGDAVGSLGPVQEYSVEGGVVACEEFDESPRDEDRCQCRAVLAEAVLGGAEGGIHDGLEAIV